MNIFVGNLAREVNPEDLREQFAPFGQVASVDIIKDKYSGQPRGFAFVEMPVAAEGQAAIAGLKGHMLLERTMDISEAHPRSGGKGGPFGGRSGGGFGKGKRGFGGRGRGRR